MIVATENVSLTTVIDGICLDAAAVSGRREVQTGL
jgi:hypothetical protein